MRTVLVGLKFVGIFFIFCAFSARAGNSNPSENLHEQAVFKKMQIAAQKNNYSGTFVYQQANQMRTSRITHLREGKNEFEKLEILDGNLREYIRRNEEVTCYIPEEKTLLLEKRVTQDVFPAIFSANSEDAALYYHFRKGTDGRVAGFSCQSILLEPKDDLRYSYRLCVEKSTGLLLRAQTLDQKNEVIEQIFFTQVEIGKIDRNRVKSSFGNVSGWRLENAAMKLVRIHDWEVKWVPPGFKKIGEMKRLVSDNSASAGDNPNKQTLAQREIAQMVFSDGLAAISVFIEPSAQSRT
ncbi:MucB/RseB C-terminal domain-containing protein, partial [Herminiimonas sp. CN]|uniref:MucB/RseB C-terminal domain-containing protein n=1 Tax=Herminiimonas sp. CN TaxID=1349818 RepID=UPI000473D48A